MFQHYTDVMPGSRLAKNGGRNYGPIAKYLGLPETIKQLLNNPASASVMHSLIDKDLNSEMDWDTTEPITISLPKFPLGFRKSTPQTKHLKKYFYPLAPMTTNPSWKHGLIPLPTDYTELMNMSVNFTCDNNVTGESKTPALCLVCGAMVCSQSHCCETIIDGHRCGGCTSHARKCGADVGIFLRIRECIIVLHSKVTRGTFLPAPYIDEFGETDKGLKRGNPLYLDPEKYEELNRMWLRNEIPEKIARMFDPDMLLYFEWHPLWMMPCMQKLFRLFVNQEMLWIKLIKCQSLYSTIYFPNTENTIGYNNYGNYFTIHPSEWDSWPKWDSQEYCFYKLSLIDKLPMVSFESKNNEGVQVEIHLNRIKCKLFT